MKKVTKDQLLAILREITIRIENDDSYQGTISWDFIGSVDDPDELSLEEDEVQVEARYRIGNQTWGQGSVRII